MFERPCYQKLDEPVLVWAGLEFREVAIGIGLGMGTALVASLSLGLGLVGLLLGFALGGGVLCLFRALRTGGPGYVFSRIYRAGLLEFLPAGIRPRYLIPLPRWGKGNEGRFRLSPVSSEDTTDGADDARKYYGR